ncbi:MAG: hypothetical protein KDA83_18875 [Planctomycetales bacterium]|nr:hypothetical protein [Planctomycetales bacterium]
MMNRQQVLELIGQKGTHLDLECFSVKYTFDFNCLPKPIDNRTVFELGRNDVGIPVAVDPSNGHVYFCDHERLSFINSSFSQMLRAFVFVNEWDIPDDMPDPERATLFTTRMIEIDSNCFCDPETCWSTMREEIEFGVI